VPQAQRVKDVMSHKVETVKPDDTLKHAAVKMEALDVGPLPVCDGEKLCGMLTDRDITVRAVASGKDPNRTTVRETMTSELCYAFEDQSIDEAVKLMHDHQVRRLPVLSHDKHLVGIVSLADLARSTDEHKKSKALEGVSKPGQGAPVGR